MHSMHWYSTVHAAVHVEVHKADCRGTSGAPSGSGNVHFKPKYQVGWWRVLYEALLFVLSSSDFPLANPTESYCALKSRCVLPKGQAESDEHVVLVLKKRPCCH